MKQLIICFFCCLNFAVQADSEQLQLTQKIEITITKPQNEPIMYTKTATLDKDLSFELGQYQFIIKTQQIKQSNQALVETTINKKNDQGEWALVAAPSILTLLKNQAQAITNDQDTKIEFHIIVEKALVAAM